MTQSYQHMHMSHKFQRVTSQVKESYFMRNYHTKKQKMNVDVLV